MPRSNASSNRTVDTNNNVDWWDDEDLSYTVLPRVSATNRRSRSNRSGTNGSSANRAPAATATPMPQPPPTRPPTPPPPPPPAVPQRATITMERLRELFQCSICQSYEPIRGYGKGCAAAHRVCAPCIQDMAGAPADLNRDCPICRGPLAFTGSTPFQERLARELTFNCTNNGCDYEMPLDLYDMDHESNCEWIPVPCPVMHCKATALKKQLLETHIRTVHKLEEQHLIPRRYEVELKSDHEPYFGNAEAEQRDLREEASWACIVHIAGQTEESSQVILLQCVASKLTDCVYFKAHNLKPTTIDRRLIVMLGSSFQRPMTRVLENQPLSSKLITMGELMNCGWVLPYSQAMDTLKVFTHRDGNRRYFELAVGIDKRDKTDEMERLASDRKLYPTSLNRRVRRHVPHSDDPADEDYEPPAQRSRLTMDTYTVDSSEFLSTLGIRSSNGSTTNPVDLTH